MTNGLLKLSIFLFIGGLITSCIGFKNGASRKGQAHYETFFINDSTIQYFIKPLPFEGEVAVTADFTFRKMKNNFSQVALNFTIVSAKPETMETFYLISHEANEKLSEVDLIYKEKIKDHYKYRYTSHISFSAMKNFITEDDTRIKYNNHVLTPTKKSKKAIDLLVADLFEFELLPQ